MTTLRPYQQEAVDAAKAHLKASVSPCLIDAATGSGKTHIIAALASWFREISGGKKVLVLAPQAELVKQGHDKYVKAGEKASIFSASAGAKSTRHPVVYATPGTVTRAISRFKTGYCAVILDECHRISPSVLSIIEEMRGDNPNLRVVGLTATPYRLGSGYIYRVGPDGRAHDEGRAREPYFSHMVYRVDARDLIAQSFLTPPVIGAINATTYDTSELVLLPNGKFDAAKVDAAFVGHGRETSAIVADVVAQSRDRQGIVFFAATIRHAEEIMASLPPSMSAIVTGETPNRASILKRFDRKEVKYLVNVGVLTTGWDCAHVDVIALLRRTESVSLLQQIIGRGLRLCDDKKDCMILDYAANLETHTPDGDLFAPVIKASGSPEGGGSLEAECPDCGYVNEFSAHKDYLSFDKDKHGYCLDVFGEQVMSEYGPVAGHHGRRCFGMVKAGSRGEYERCGYFYTHKECPACEEKNDIAARFCRSCKGELINPNEKLVADFKAMKKDPTQLQTDKVLSMSLREGTSSRGNLTVRADFVTPYRQFSVWFAPEASAQIAQRKWARFKAATEVGHPETITYRKDAESGFFEILAYNQPADEEPEQPGGWGNLAIRQAKQASRQIGRKAA